MRPWRKFMAAIGGAATAAGLLFVLLKVVAILLPLD